MLAERQIKILMLAHELEKSLGELYALFSKLFPDQNSLWEQLIREENEHAEAVRNLYQMSYEGKSAFDEGNIKPEAIQSFIDYIKETMDSARRGKFSVTRAVSTACDIEHSLLEKDFFSHFKVSPSASSTLRILIKGTQGHAGLVKKELAKIQTKQKK